VHGVKIQELKWNLQFLIINKNSNNFMQPFLKKIFRILPKMLRFLS